MKKLQWLGVLVAFCVFASLLTGMSGMGATSVSQAAGKVARPGHGSLIVVKHFPLFNRFFGLEPTEEVCWVEPSQLKQIKARWLTAVHTIQVTYRHHHHSHTGTFNLVTVLGPTKTELRPFISPRKGTCTLVRRSWAFFLPFDGSVS